MRLKIISDGIGPGTKVVDADTGEELEGVTSVRWEVGAGTAALATIQLEMVPVELEVEDPIVVTVRPEEKRPRRRL